MAPKQSNPAGLRVFVYGTLKPGGFYWGRYAEGKVAAHQPARVRGLLYDLSPGYPGLLEGEGWAQGVLLTLQDEAALQGFDELEGYVEGRPEAENEYQRRSVECWDLDGDSLGQVWVYLMLPEKMREMGGIRLKTESWDGPLPRPS
ncbi:gamma-glutamylcyclotransferase family protein [Ruficoccus sp. ZRK36]|uniref:gamma-glutamylcyclotransferase family protein n=1 Tax=Ruficoccus sp. ZRK36 TaxID=2866311 RepID=UPI001C72D0A2|nr:gamma-glutamylcyclotransferase family protein [Ruficoccus sp. ZRK36]QYY36777.1 gamma-glutamylcyclotransferase [Ruficoccus sp. ZRK36]